MALFKMEWEKELSSNSGKTLMMSIRNLRIIDKFKDRFQTTLPESDVLTFFQAILIQLLYGLLFGSYLILVFFAVSSGNLREVFGSSSGVPEGFPKKPPRDPEELA